MGKHIQGKYTGVNLPMVRLPIENLQRVSLPSLIFTNFNKYCGQSYARLTYRGKYTWVKLPRKSYPRRATRVKLLGKAYLGPKSLDNLSRLSIPV